MKNQRRILVKLFLIPQRYVLGIMGLLAVCNAYTMRVCLNLAITQMVKKTVAVEGDEHFDPDACPVTEIGAITNTTEHLENVLDNNRIFDWDEATQGLLLGSFYYGYVLTHIPGGILSERYGGKWVLGLGLLSTALCTLVTPAVTRAGGASALFVLRVVEGLGEGPTIPALMSLLSRWAPKSERGRMGSIVFGGSQMGNIVGHYLSGLILSDSPWDNVFYVFGVIGIIWFTIWAFICYSTPNSHPFIREAERQFLIENVEALRSSEYNRLPPVPWKSLLLSWPVWVLVIAGIGHEWGYSTVVTNLPKYMVDVLKFNIKSAGILSSLPYICMWISSFVFGALSDYCIERNYHSTLTARKLYTTIAATGPGICIIIASYSSCNYGLVVFWFIAAMTLMGAYYSGMKINPLDISPNYAGTTTALVNGVAAISAIATPYLIGILAPDSTLKQWREAFWVCLGVLVITNVVYLIWAQAEQLSWDHVSTKKKAVELDLNISNK